MQAEEAVIEEVQVAAPTEVKVERVKHEDHVHEVVQAENTGGPDNRIPTTILTGFLGAGKTTLLNWILSSNEHGKRIAVIENEFGEIGIDDKLVKQRQDSGNEQIVEMNNGCICCTVRVDLMLALESLSEKKDSFDAIIIETTGMADPTPVAQTFHMDEAVAKWAKLDAIITVVDSHHILQQLDAVRQAGAINESVKQVAFADRIILNKAELCTPEQIAKIQKRIKLINQVAEMMPASLKEKPVPMDFVLGLDKFSLERAKELHPGFLTDTRDTVHDAGISSCGLRIPGSFSMMKINQYFQRLMAVKGQDLMRYKGILSIYGEKTKFVFHGVHMLFDAAPGNSEWADDEERVSELVFIGYNINGPAMEKEFRDCLFVQGGKLRFDVGDKVEARTQDGWKDATIKLTWQGDIPYIIELEGETEADRFCVIAPEDHDMFVRARGSGEEEVHVVPEPQQAEVVNIPPPAEGK